MAIIIIIITIIFALKAEGKHWVLGQRFSTKGLRGDALSSSASGYGETVKSQRDFKSQQQVHGSMSPGP